MSSSTFLALALAFCAQSPTPTPTPSTGPTPTRAPAQAPQSQPPLFPPPGAHSTAPNAPAAPAQSAPVAPPPIEPEAWKGTLADGMRELRRRAEGNDVRGALALSEGLVAPSAFARWKETALADAGWKGAIARRVEPIADALGLAGPPPSLRAEVHFAAGVAAQKQPDLAPPDDAYARSLALAGPGDLRIAAAYQLGTRALLEGEEWRAKIPEIAQKNGAPPPAAAPAPPMPALPGTGEQPPDPLQIARAEYTKARERFIALLRDDWRDADARANTELVQRRLKELDEIEKQREEQQQQQKQDQKNQDEKDKDQQKQDQQKQDQQKQDQQDQDQQKQDEQKPEDEQQKQDEKKPEEQKPDEQKDEEKSEQAPQPAEQRELSKEEMTRLLDLLKQREEQWKKLQQQLQHARRGKVKKDW